MWKPGNRTMWKQITRLSFLALTAVNLEGCGTLDFSTKVMPENTAHHNTMRGGRGLRRISLSASLTAVAVLRTKVPAQPRPEITDPITLSSMIFDVS